MLQIVLTGCQWRFHPEAHWGWDPRVVTVPRCSRTPCGLAYCAEKTYGLAESELTPALSWSKVSFINHMNAWKDGRDPTAVANADGTSGLIWRDEVSADAQHAQARLKLANQRRSLSRT